MSAPTPPPPPPVPTPPPPPPSPSPPMSQKLLGNFELPSDLEWLTKKQRSKNPPRVRRIPKPDILDFLRENSSKPSSDYSSRGLSPKLDAHNAHDSGSSLKIGPSGSTSGVPSSRYPRPATKPRRTSSKVQERKGKNVKVDREGKPKSQEMKEKGKGDEKKIKEKEPTRDTRAKIKLPTFSRQLTPQEIADDLYAMTGSRPTRKPKKRPKSVQRQVDKVTPGLWLEFIKRNRYNSR